MDAVGRAKPAGLPLDRLGHVARLDRFRRAVSDFFADRIRRRTVNRHCVANDWGRTGATKAGYQEPPQATAALNVK